MKKRMLLLTGFLTWIFAVTVYAEPLAVLSDNSGNLSIEGFVTGENGDGGTAFAALFQYENLSDESSSPMFEYTILAYQDGIQLEYGYICDFSYENYKTFNTDVLPGEVLPFYNIFKLESDSPVVIEVSSVSNYGNPFEYTFDLSDELIPGQSTQENASAESSSSYCCRKDC